jgi:hypothetical protein
VKVQWVGMAVWELEVPLLGGCGFVPWANVAAISNVAPMP